MSFIYSPYHAPYTGAIAETMLIPAQAQARAAEQSGAAWAGAAQNIGQMVGGIPAQIQKQQVDALRTRAFTNEVSEQDRAIAARKVLAATMQTTPKLSEDGVSVWDVPAITRVMADRGFGPEAGAAAQHLDAINTAFRQTRAAQLATVQRGAQAVAAAGNDPTLAGHFLDQLEANQLYPKKQIDEYRAFIEADPANVGKLTAYLMGPQKLTVVPQGGTAIDPSGRAIATGQPKPPTKAELGLKAAQGDPEAQKALDLLTPAKNPPSLEEQYLTAVSKGDKATASTILKSIHDTADAKKDPAMQAMAKELAGLRMDEARARLDERNPTSEKNQAKFEQEYRTVLARGLSSRSGGLGLEDAKVQQANHLLALLDQTYDPKTDTYSIPKVLQGELAAGLARLVAPGGQVGIEMMREFNQKTAKEGLANALTFITGTPFPTATQDIAKMLKDSIERQGHVALENREGEMRYLRGLAPTDLDEGRRTKLEATSLNPLRQSRVIQNKTTGERKVQVSLDGGQTWK